MHAMTSRPTELPEGTPTNEVVSALAAALRAHGVRGVLVRAPGADAAAAGCVAKGGGRHDLDLLVPRASRHAADEALSALDWRVAIGGLGKWARIPTVTYHWEYAPNLEVHRGLPVGPLPPGSLRRLERMLFGTARPTPCGIDVPDAAALAVFAAVQAARPGFFREMWLDDVAVHVASSGDGARRLAADLGVASALRWATGPLTDGAVPGAAGPLFDARFRAWGWTASLAARRHVRPRILGSLLGGVPRVGTAVARSRFGGVELLAGPGAFTPQLVSEPMVPLALEGLPSEGPAIAVDVGTGVGAVALALAKVRPDVEVHGCDLSTEGLRWARKNQRRLGLGNVSFHHGSLLEPLDESLLGRVDVITANVPYVPPHVFGDSYRDREAAVLGQGPDGLGLQRELVAQAAMFLKPGGRFIVQMAIDQWELFVPDTREWGFTPRGMAASSFEDAICWAVANV